MNKNKKGKSQAIEVFKRLCKNKQAVVGMIILAFMLLTILISIIAFDYEIDIIEQDLHNRLQAPSLEHPFGTDSFGRDTFKRILYGGKNSIAIGVTVTIFSLVVGGALGAIAGYCGGKTDNLIMRLLDVLAAIPGMLMAIAIVSALGPGMKNLIIAMTVGSIPGYSRIIRAQVFSIKSTEFIDASKVVGASEIRIVLSHIIPNSMAPIIVRATMGMGGTILSAAALSFLGLGIMPPEPEWGAILSEGKRYIMQSPYLVLFPGLAIMLCVLSLNFIGDGLRDALDPKLKN